MLSVKHRDVIIYLDVFIYRMITKYIDISGLDIKNDPAPHVLFVQFAYVKTDKYNVQLSK